MPHSKSPPYRRPTHGELSILRVLWEHGPSTVREVHDRLAVERPTVYTTTLKMLQLMRGKRLVRRGRGVGPQRYSAVLDQAACQRHLLGSLLTGVFNGSARALVVQALDLDAIDASELADVRRLLADGGEDRQ